jgi:hypothetical protein
MAGVVKLEAQILYHISPVPKEHLVEHVTYQLSQIKFAARTFGMAWYILQTTELQEGHRQVTNVVKRTALHPHLGIIGYSKRVYYVL